MLESGNPAIFSSGVSTMGWPCFKPSMFKSQASPCPLGVVCLMCSQHRNDKYCPYCSRMLHEQGLCLGWKGSSGLARAGGWLLQTAWLGWLEALPAPWYLWARDYMAAKPFTLWHQPQPQGGLACTLLCPDPCHAQWPHGQADGASLQCSL